MTDTFCQESKINDDKKIIEDCLKSNLAVLGSFKKTKRKWFYFKNRFLNLDESDKHRVRILEWNAW